MKSKGLLIFFAYWVLFVIIPASVPVITLGISVNSILVTIILLFLLIVIAERGLRIWGNLFNNK